jgi:hypothetical protein
VHNLSFDTPLRQQMLGAELVQQVWDGEGGDDGGKERGGWEILECERHRALLDARRSMRAAWVPVL